MNYLKIVLFILIFTCLDISDSEKQRFAAINITTNQSNTFLEGDKFKNLFYELWQDERWARSFNLPQKHKNLIL